MKGSELRCDCGAGAVDMARDYELDSRTAYVWHCANGHELISGCRPGFDGLQQMQFDGVSDDAGWPLRDGPEGL